MYRLRYSDSILAFYIEEEDAFGNGFIYWWLDGDTERQIVLDHFSYVGGHLRAHQDEFLHSVVGRLIDEQCVRRLEALNDDEEPSAEQFFPEDSYVEPLFRPDRSDRDEDGSQGHENCGCATCKFARFEDSPLAPAMLHSYNYNPGWEMHGEGDYFLGVELETDSYRTSRVNSGITVQSEFPVSVATAMRVPYDFWVPKEDGSVSGPEFCSHPASLAYWRSIRPEVEQMFTMLLHAGYRSHDNDTCGMHVNISRAAFKDPGHLFRFLTLLHADVVWALRMSQRTPGSMKSWASLHHGDTEVKREDMADKYWRGQEISHGAALNCPDEDSGERFEFRLPRGTLRVDRFYKNLEWTVAMIEFTRNGRKSASTPDKFMKWAREQGEYPDLVAFLDERFPVAVAA